MDVGRKWKPRFVYFDIKDGPNLLFYKIRSIKAQVFVSSNIY